MRRESMVAVLATALACAVSGTGASAFAAAGPTLIEAPAVGDDGTQRGRRGLGRGGGRGGQGQAQRFEAAAPSVGDPMPDVVVYDDEGREQRLPQLLRGHYSVVILGCLT